MGNTRLGRVQKEKSTCKSTCKHEDREGKVEKKAARQQTLSVAFCIYNV